ncbi:MAG: DUF2807 domain-containing protein [Bacteroidetes bacterium]|jgi:hypothetical protein|nr:DUF2807 domain-containing protein [Bacteroidota bacterium]
MKRKNLNLLFILLMGLSFGMTSCDGDGFFGDCTNGEGSVVTQTLNIEHFNGIELDISDNVHIRQGSEQFVEVTGHVNIIEKLKTDVNNNIWKIDLENGCYNNYELEIFITLPKVRGIKIDGSGDVFGENLFTGEEIDLEIDGSGNLIAALDYDKIKGDIDGSGDISLKGQAQNLDFRIDGSGNLSAFDLTVDHADVRIDGSGDISITVLNTLNVTINGSGDVRYKGNPFLEVDIDGSGDVSDAN